LEALEGNMSSNPFSRAAHGSDPDTVDFDDLARAVSAAACTVVDVREPHEFAAGHIPNALNMPMSRFDPSQLPRERPVVLVCQGGARSRNALNRVRAIGREDVKHYAGGTAGWRAHGGELSR
jgi:rhodanese-related sulfurtransferase